MASSRTYPILTFPFSLSEHKHMIATAATNGAVVIWNMNKEGQRQGKKIIEKPHLFISKIVLSMSILVP